MHGFSNHSSARSEQTTCGLIKASSSQETPVSLEIADEVTRARSDRQRASIDKGSPPGWDVGVELGPTTMPRENLSFLLHSMHSVGLVMHGLRRNGSTNRVSIYAR